MLRIFLECGIRAALIVAGTGIVLSAMRVKAAAVKHRVWTAVVLLMLILPLWIAWGPKAPLRVLPPSIERVVDETTSMTGTLSSAPVPQQATSAQKSLEPKRTFPRRWQIVSLSVYLLGVFSLIFRLALGTVKAHALNRYALLCDGQRTSGSCAAPVTVGLLHPTTILPEGWSRWPQARLDAVLIHEGEHARRCDPLIQWLALLNRAVFWFHPVAWWLERQLSMLAEEACDVAVLASGCDPRDYAETLVEMARSVMHSGARVNVVGMAMPGGFLPRRIRKIIQDAPVPRISRTRMACVAAACALTSGAFAAGTLERSRQGGTPGDLPTFDVVSIRAMKADKPEDLLGNIHHKPVGTYAVNHMGLRGLIAAEFFLDYNKRRLVFGGPAWIDSETFYIQASAKGSPGEDPQQLMIQRLIEEKFKLVMHHEIQQLPAYALVLSEPGKLGPQLTPHSDTAKCSNSPLKQPGPSEPMSAYCKGFFMNPRPGHMRETGNEMEIEQLGTFLSQSLDRTVADRTGLNGFYDFAIEFAPSWGFGSEPAAGESAPPPSALPSIFTAVQEQLGLKLVPQTEPVDVIVIDRVEEPPAN
jgi:bla regulator protein blaR1